MVLLMPNPDTKPCIHLRSSSERTAPGDYALFTLPHVFINGLNIVTDERAVVNIPLRAKLLSGYTGKFTIRLGNGVTGIMTINHAGTKTEMSGEYSDNQMINNFPASTFPVDSDFAELNIKPVNNWLAPRQQFHVFKISMGYPQYSDSEKQLPPDHIPDILFGIQRPD
ncbi:MAG TPA: hypothetical protein VJU78_20060 [Chitinophagaceae bacterium]|nr:hypothetical protein [Chitinophagaceae bacterium]